MIDIGTPGVRRALVSLLPFVLSAVIAVSSPAENAVSRVLKDAKERGNVDFGERREDVESICIFTADIRSLSASVYTAILFLIVLQQKHLVAAVETVGSDDPQSLIGTITVVVGLFLLAVLLLVILLIRSRSRLHSAKTSPLRYATDEHSILGTNIVIRPGVRYIVLVNAIGAAAAVTSSIIVS